MKVSNESLRSRKISFTPLHGKYRCNWPGGGIVKRAALEAARSKRWNELHAAEVNPPPVPKVLVQEAFNRAGDVDCPCCHRSIYGQVWNGHIVSSQCECGTIVIAKPHRGPDPIPAGSCGVIFHQYENFLA